MLRAALIEGSYKGLGSTSAYDARGGAQTLCIIRRVLGEETEDSIDFLSMNLSINKTLRGKTRYPRTSERLESDPWVMRALGVVAADMRKEGVTPWGAAVRRLRQHGRLGR